RADAVALTQPASADTLPLLARGVCGGKFDKPVPSLTLNSSLALRRAICEQQNADLKRHPA
ncbi:hypothetical protein BaRGS_00012337, partial [Batillaria attramentaria]